MTVIVFRCRSCGNELEADSADIGRDGWPRCCSPREARVLRVPGFEIENIDHVDPDRDDHVWRVWRSRVYHEDPDCSVLQGCYEDRGGQVRYREPHRVHRVNAEIACWSACVKCGGST